jgi:hypothetical protein
MPSYTYVIELSDAERAELNDETGVFDTPYVDR